MTGEPAMTCSMQTLCDCGVISIDSSGVVRLTPEAWQAATIGTKYEERGALHFVGFKDDRWWHAIAVWGHPDFVHRHWDHRAVCEIAPGDFVIFANGDETAIPTPFAYDDSANF